MDCIRLKHVAILDGYMSDTNFAFIWSLKILPLEYM